MDLEVVADDQGDAVPPAEPVIFLTPWSRFGLRRLMAIDEFGDEGGYLDLRTGDVSGTTGTSEAVLRQVLPQLGSGPGRIGVSTEDWAVVESFLASESTAETRYEAQSIVVGCRLENRWMDRLFIHRVAPDSGNVDLGWVNLKDDRIHADVDGVEPVLRYCRLRYQKAFPSKS